jgi:hypothetical protein
MTGPTTRADASHAPSPGWHGVREESHAPARASDSAVRPWARFVRKFALDVGVVLLLMAAIPVIAVTIPLSSYWTKTETLVHAQWWIHLDERIRPFAIPGDPGISPLDAGTAFASFAPSTFNPLIERETGWPSDLSWQHLTISPPMFAPHSTRHSGNLPEWTTVLDASTKGFSPQEMDFLRALAKAPVWMPFDRVARARAVDEVGGMYKLPIPRTVVWWNLPPVAYERTAEIAHAAVARAAYHLAIGQRDSAEAVLRSIVAFGFHLLDNGTGLARGYEVGIVGLVLVDEEAASSVIRIGSDALDRFFAITKDPRLTALRASRPTYTVGLAASHLAPLTPEESRARLLELATDARQARGVRLASLEMLSVSTCTNLRDLFFGPRPDVRAAFETAKRELVRYPADLALLDLIERDPVVDVADDYQGSILRQLTLASSTVAGVVVHNPRFATCTAIATQGGRPLWSLFSPPR